jgi:hypothetical protein
MLKAVPAVPRGRGMDAFSLPLFDANAISSIRFCSSAFRIRSFSRAATKWQIL